MAWQLIYTSAEHGLAAGRSGFCTVARHAEIRERLVSELERLSAYDRSPTGQPLPRIRTHRILTIGNDRYHILSCIQDAGADYSGRTNHIAHHLICEEQELGSASSPALVLLRFPWLACWNKAARYFDASEAVDLGSFCTPPPQEGAWQALTGNAGHMRLLTEPARLRTGCFVAYTHGRDDQLLELFHESLQQLAETNSGPRAMWQISFTTLLQGTDNPTDFAWRGCWAGSLVHRTAAAAFVLDLTQPGSLPEPSPITLVTPQPQRTTVAAVSRIPQIPYRERPRATRVKAPTLSPSRRSSHWLVWAGSAVVVAALVGLWISPKTKKSMATSAEPNQRSPEQLAATSNIVVATGVPTGQTASSGQADTDLVAKPLPMLVETPPPAPAVPPQSPEQKDLDLLPDVPTYFFVGNPGKGIRAIPAIPSPLPAECRALFSSVHFTNFPSLQNSDSLANLREFSYYKGSTEKLVVNLTEGSIALKDTAYQHVALWITNRLLILLNEKEIPVTNGLPQMHFSTNHLVVTDNGQKVALGQRLRQRLETSFPAHKFRLVATGLSAQNLAAGEWFSINIQERLRQLEGKLEGLGAARRSLEEQQRQALQDALSGLRNLLTNAPLSEGSRLLDIDPSLNAPDLAKFKPRDSYNGVQDLWRHYLGEYLQNLYNHVRGTYLTDQKLKLPDMLEPTKTKPMELRDFAKNIETKNSAGITTDTRDKLRKFTKAWEGMFTVENLNKVQTLLDTPERLKRDLEQNERERRAAEEARNTFPKKVTELGQLRVEILVNTQWVPFIYFSDQP